MLACVCYAHLDCNQGLDRFAQSSPLCTRFFPPRDPTSTCAHPLNTQHHRLVLKSAGVFPHGASKRQGLRDQRLLRLCSSARLLSTLMQMCARQSGGEGRQDGSNACGVWVTIDLPTIHICGVLRSHLSWSLFLTLCILRHSLLVSAAPPLVCFSRPCIL